MLITVRVGLGWDLLIDVTGEGDSPQAMTLSPFQAYPLRPIRLQVTRTVEQHTDFALRLDRAKGRESVLDIQKPNIDSLSSTGRSTGSDDGNGHVLFP